MFMEKYLVILELIMREKNGNAFKLILVITFLLFIITTLFLTNKIRSEQLLAHGNTDESIFNNKDNKKVKISIEHSKEIMSGLYNQYQKLNIPIIKLVVENPFNKSVSVYLESEVVGLTYKTKSTNVIDGGETTNIVQYPPLISDVRFESNHTAALNYMIKVDGKIVAEQSVLVKFVASDVLFWGYFDSEHNFVSGSSLISAWVTPNHSQIRKLLKIAVKHHPNRSLYGYQLETNDIEKLRLYSEEQVRAIYNAIKEDYDINYVNTPVSFTPKNIVAQRINLPSETLSRGIANCIDSVVLFASALEAIGMEPYILILPGHSLLGWSISEGSRSIDFIDVTYVSEIDFDEAVTTAYKIINESQIDLKDSVGDNYSLISIKKARDDFGIDPIE